MKTLLQSLVLSQFKKMTRGSMTIELMDGAIEKIGEELAEPRASIKIKNSQFYRRCLLFGAIGFAESYIHSEWETDDITSVIAWFIQNMEQSTVLEGSKNKSILVNMLALYNKALHTLRDNSMKMSKTNIREHYDLGNEFFATFLDKSMTYSSAIFESEKDSLDEAQLRKIDRLCEKLKLSASDSVLEIGTGWGALAIHLATKYGCKVTTITLSQEQYDFVNILLKEKNLSDRIEVRIQDYREVQGQFDKIISVEMVEALGDKYVDLFFERCAHLLAPNGLLGIQMITTPDCRYDLLKNGVDFIQKHIFPGSLLLSVGRVVEATNRTSSLYLFDLFDFAESYALTLKTWRERFNARVSDIRALGFDDAFIRKWNYYFSYCEAAFMTRQISVVQAVFTRPNNTLLAGKLSE